MTITIRQQPAGSGARASQAAPHATRAGAVLGGLFVAAYLVLLSLAPAALAQELDFRWHRFADNDGTVVNTTTANAQQQLGEDGKQSFTFSYSVDRVSMPAIKGVPGSQEQIDAVTAASRPVSGAHQSSETYEKTRQQLLGGYARGGINAQMYISIEEDWNARQAQLGYSRELRGGNTVLGIGSSFGWDTITPLTESGEAPALDHRQAVSILGSMAQTLDIRTQSRLTVEVGRVGGFQGNPYRSVRTDSSTVAEQHPRQRVRTSVSGELMRYLDSQSVVRIDYRFYRDDWSVQSHTGQAEFKQVLGDDVIVRYRYRYYTQQAAYFYRERYTETDGVDGFLTADYKLAPLSSNLFGARVTLPALELLHLGRWFSDARINLKYERYYNSTDFAAGIFETGLAFLF